MSIYVCNFPPQKRIRIVFHCIKKRERGRPYNSPLNPPARAQTRGGVALVHYISAITRTTPLAIDQSDISFMDILTSSLALARPHSCFSSKKHIRVQWVEGADPLESPSFALLPKHPCPLRNYPLLQGLEILYHNYRVKRTRFALKTHIQLGCAKCSLPDHTKHNEYMFLNTLSKLEKFVKGPLAELIMWYEQHYSGPKFESSQSEFQAGVKNHLVCRMPKHRSKGLASVIIVFIWATMLLCMGAEEVQRFSPLAQEDLLNLMLEAILPSQVEFFEVREVLEQSK